MENFELEINKSRFLAYKLDLNSIEEVKPFIEKLKKEHKKARHFCYAYVFNKDVVSEKCSDDGEPGFEDAELNVEEASFRDDETARRYIDTAICKNIQHSLKCYQKGRYFRHLRELYDANELTNAINRTNTGICLYCENNDVDTSIIKSQCHRCDNRYWVETTGATEDVDALGNCHHCNNTSTISKSTKAECYRCENRYWVETTVATENTVALGDCYVCPTGMTRDEKTGVCACGENELYDRYNKKCVSCPDTTSGVLSTEQASETSCPMIRYYSNDTYSYSCSVATQNPTTTKENCLFCGKDVRFWKGKNLYCYNCLDTDEVTETERSECEVCSKRYWAETTAATETVEALGTCYPCPTGMSRDIVPA